MSLTEKDVKKMAYLARISINDQETAEFKQELSKILKMVEQMNQADDELSQVTPMSHALEILQRSREDIVTESNQRELFQQNAPETAHGLYLVEEVIE